MYSLTRRCRVLGTKRKFCGRPEQDRFWTRTGHSRLIFAVMHKTALIQLCRKVWSGVGVKPAGWRDFISLLVGALRPGFHPSLDERARLLLRARRGLASKSWRPGPTDQMIFADMLDERIE